MKEGSGSRVQGSGPWVWSSEFGVRSSWSQARRRFDPIRLVRWIASLAAVVGLLGNGALGADPSRRSSLAETIDEVQPKIVKVYGAGGLRGLEDYQSGLVVSAEGHIVTAFSYVLDTDRILAVMNDGRRLPANLVGADPRLEVAVLKIDATGLPHFDLLRAAEADAGTRALAFSNMFGVAMGDEAATVQRAVVAVKTNLDARRGVFQTPYNGPVYVLDTVTNNPGAAGGALVTYRGELIGMLGKELRNVRNNTWLNYVVPVDQFRQSVEAIRAGKFVATKEDGRQRPARPLTTDMLGIVLVPDVVQRTPPYVDAVRPNSAAAKAGIRPDDLVVLVNDHLVQSCKALSAELEFADSADPVRLTLLRGQEMVETQVKAAGEERRK